jgi:two-component system cell cycle response regulator DivK
MGTCVLATDQTRARSNSKAERSAPRRRAVPSARPVRVLVVDDFEDARAIYAEYLQFVGFVPITAANGREAVDSAAAELPDVIVMDLAMPVMDGVEATRRLKRDPRTAHIPVIACTGQVHGDELEKAKAAGFASIVLKPVELDQLASVVQQHVPPMSQH